MAPSTTANMQRVERDVLDHFKEGVGLRTIGLRVDLEYAEVQEIVNELAGGDKERARRMVADYDKTHAGDAPAPARAKLPEPGTATDGPPVRKPPATRTPAAARRTGRAAAQPADDGPPAPTVVPVDLTEAALADAPLTTTEPAADEPPAAPDPTPTDPEALAPAGGRAADLPLEPAPVLAAAPTPPSCTHGGDCLVHPEVGGLHNFEAIADRDRLARAADEQAALAGATEPLPEVSSFEELMAAVGAVPELAELAGDVQRMVDLLHDRYDRERQARTVRGEAAILRRELDTRLALLAALAAPAGLPQVSTAVTAAA